MLKLQLHWVAEALDLLTARLLANAKQSAFSWVYVGHLISAKIRPEISPIPHSYMELRQNKPLRNLGIYKLFGSTLIALKQSEELTFLFSLDNWRLLGPVDYRVSHGRIYRCGHPTGWTDSDLQDTEMTANSRHPARH